MKKRWKSRWVASGGEAVGEPLADKMKVKHWPTSCLAAAVSVLPWGRRPVYWPRWNPSPAQSSPDIHGFSQADPRLKRCPRAIDLNIHLVAGCQLHCPAPNTLCCVRRWPWGLSRPRLRVSYASFSQAVPDLKTRSRPHSVFSSTRSCVKTLSRFSREGQAQLC